MYNDRNEQNTRALTQISRSAVADLRDSAERDSEDKSLHHTQRKAQKAVAAACGQLLEQQNSAETVKGNISAVYNIMTGFINGAHRINLLTGYGKDFAIDIMFLSAAHTFDGVNKFIWFVRENGTHIYALPLDNRANENGTAAVIDGLRKGSIFGREKIMEFEIDMIARSVTVKMPDRKNVVLRSYEQAHSFVFDLGRAAERAKDLTA